MGIFLTFTAIGSVPEVIQTHKGLTGDCQPVILKGVMDLKCWEGEALRLTGEWSFEWQALEPSHAKGVGHPPDYARIPGRWRSMNFKDGRSPIFGQAEYAVRLDFSSSVRNDLAIFPGIGITGLEVFIRLPGKDDQLVYTNRSEAGTEIIPATIVNLPVVQSGSELVLRVRNTSHYSGAMEFEPVIGTIDGLIKEQMFIRGWMAILFGGYIFFGIYNLILAMGYERNRTFVVLSGICFICAVRMLGPETLITVFLENVPLPFSWHIGWATFFLLGVCWSLYIYYRYPSPFTLLGAKILIGLSVTGLALVAITRSYIFIEFGTWYRILILIYMMVLVPSLVIDYRKGKLQSSGSSLDDKITLSTLILMLVAVATDIVLYVSYSRMLVDFSSLAFFILIAGQTFIIARQYTRVLENERQLTSELRAVNQGLEDEVSQRTAQLTQANEKLEEMVRTDQLTGLPNRKAFEETLAKEIERYDRTGLPLSLFILDADYFKAINDDHGHDIGDIVLKHLANIISQEARVIDMPARIGGEEFAIVLTQTDIDGARMLAERIRQEVEKAIIVSVGEEIRFTISGGIAAYQPEEKPQTFFRKADQALYLAKERGRNRIEVDETSGAGAPE
ncbi:MAG: diguanylate cyclase [Gammaproteobacteria bacterium]|nr:diguanylate cyclase [Gammaproteobacteria bacterium]